MYETVITPGCGIQLREFVLFEYPDGRLPGNMAVIIPCRLEIHIIKPELIDIE
jgi:hypothetical protein